MPQISVIIPVYNAEKYLRACLDSVLGQTFKDVEVICVNDGSQDSSGNILAEYARKDKRICLITQSNQGQGSARNKGLDGATGQWICFVDADDVLPNYSLQVLYDLAQQTQVEIVCSRVFLKMTDKGVVDVTQSVAASPLPHSVFQNGLADFVKDNKIFSSPCNKLFRADLLRKFRFPEGIVFEDWPLMTILFGQIKKYTTTDIPCYFYRESEVSTIHSPFNQYKVSCYLKGIQIVYEAFCKTELLDFAQQRMAIAVKMMVNKVYHTKDKDLAAFLVAGLQNLFDQKIIAPKHLFLKTRWRLWRLKHQ